MLHCLLILMLPLLSLGGSPCPPRENIYPCSCANIQQSKRVLHTVVTCHRLADTLTLSSLKSSLRTVQIDQLHLYDSFWEETTGGFFPEDWLSSFKVKEFDVVDTKLAPCFACRWNRGCENMITTRFTAVNSTGSDFCPLCGSKNFHWTSCLARLQRLDLIGGNLENIEKYYFPFKMQNLITLNLTRNQISDIDPKAFEKLPEIKSLDLSHNRLTRVNFLGQSPRLQFVDLSENYIKEIGPVFGKLPVLVTFKLENNDVAVLNESDWKEAPGSLYNIDLNGNPLHCDCGVRFVNSTFHVSIALRGTCNSPPDYQGSPLRRAARYLVERCDEDGNIGTRPPKQSAVTIAKP